MVVEIFRESHDSVVIKGNREKEEKKCLGIEETRGNSKGENYGWERKQRRCKRDKEVEKKRMSSVNLNLSQFFSIFHILMIN